MSEQKTGKKIFIIDDDAFLLEMYALKFTQKGFDVNSASGTVEALEKLSEGYAPDIMLVDIVMPTMDGFEFLAKVKEDGLAKDAVTIVLSNLGQPEDIDKGLQLGASGYIIKASSTPSEVVEKVEEVVLKKKT